MLLNAEVSNRLASETNSGALPKQHSQVATYLSELMIKLVAQPRTLKNRRAPFVLPTS